MHSRCSDIGGDLVLKRLYGISASATVSSYKVQTAVIISMLNYRTEVMLVLGIELQNLFWRTKPLKNDQIPNYLVFDI